MQRISKETGGGFFEVSKKRSIGQIFAIIQEELRSQYNVGYTPTNTALDGTFRKVEIQANKKDYKIQARTGYYAVARKD